MRRLPSIAAAVTLFSITPAGAEDFTGFYAGVNAGYALSRDGDRQGVVSSPSLPAPDAETGLPPSALSAAERMEERRPGARRIGPR